MDYSRSRFGKHLFILFYFISGLWKPAFWAERPQFIGNGLRIAKPMAFFPLPWRGAWWKVRCPSHCELTYIDNQSWRRSVGSAVLLPDHFTFQELYPAGNMLYNFYKVELHCCNGDWRRADSLVNPVPLASRDLVSFSWRPAHRLPLVWLIQAESAVDQMDWIEKITGVIASLLSSQSPERV